VSHFLIGLLLIAVILALPEAAALAQETGGDEAAAFEQLQTECFGCTFLEVVLRASDAFAREAYELLRSQLVGEGALLYYIVALWIVLQATKLFFPSMTEDPGQVVKGLAVKGLLITIVTTALLVDPVPSAPDAPDSGRGGTVFFEYGPYLALDVGAKGGEAIANTFQAVQDQEGNKLVQDCGASQTVDMDFSAFGGGIRGLDETQNADSVDSLMCQIHTMQALAATGLRVAGYMLNQDAWFDGKISYWDALWGVTDAIIGTLANVIYVVLGALLLFMLFVIILVAVPFYFIDVIIRLFMVAAFSPILLVCGLWKPTRGMLVTSVKIMFGACMNLIGLGLVYGLSSTMMRLAPFFVQNDAREPYQSLPALMQGMQSADVYGVFGISSTGYWIFLMAGVLMLLLLNKISALVSSLFGDSDFGSNMGRQAAGLAKTGVFAAAAVASVPVGMAAAGVAKGGASTLKAAGGGLMSAQRGVRRAFGQSADRNLQ
jgi:hypothetical protein